MTAPFFYYPCVVVSSISLSSYATYILVSSIPKLELTLYFNKIMPENHLKPLFQSIYFIYVYAHVYMYIHSYNLFFVIQQECTVKRTSMNAL